MVKFLLERLYRLLHSFIILFYPHVFELFHFSDDFSRSVSILKYDFKDIL